MSVVAGIAAGASFVLPILAVALLGVVDRLTNQPNRSER